MEQKQFDVVVIGAGPGGYTAALQCVKYGLSVALVEKDKLGGVCLNVGCIPTKALINIAEHVDEIKNIAGVKNVAFDLDKLAMNEQLSNVSSTIVKGIDFLLKKSNVCVFTGDANFVDEHTINVEQQQLVAKYIILAIGSSNKSVDRFMENPADNNQILNSTSALFTDNIPKKLVVIGGGAIGTEFAYIYSCLGCEVTILEYQQILLPNMDEECGKTLERAFKKRNINVVTGAAVTKISVNGENKVVSFCRKDKNEEISSDAVLMAMGRQPNTIAGLDKILPDVKGYIPTNEKMQTTVENIFAIGDIRANSPQLAHVAYKEATVAADNIAIATGKKTNSPSTLDINLVPFGVYTEPQVSGFGLTESAAKAKCEVKIKKMLMRANGKSVAVNKIDGFVKIICDSNDKILGAWIVGNCATEIIHEIMMCASMNGTVNDITNLIHAHPTISEIISETASI